MQRSGAVVTAPAWCEVCGGTGEVWDPVAAVETMCTPCDGQGVVTPPPPPPPPRPPLPSRLEE